MGTPLDWKFLTHNFFFSFGIDPRKVPISKTASLRSKAFRYDSLETRELFWVKTPMGIQVHFKDFFFCLCEWILTWLKIDYKWGSHWLGHIKQWLESKILLARSPPGGFGGAEPPQCRPPSYLVMDEVMGSDRKNCFDEAENRAASSLGVGANR